MGSFVPWLYYSFYCSPQPRLIYLTIVCVLGIAAIIVAQWDRFSTPRHRPTRAGADHFRIIRACHCDFVRLMVSTLKGHMAFTVAMWLEGLGCWYFQNECRQLKSTSSLRCIHGTRIKWHCPHHALHHRGGLCEGHHSRTDGLVLPDGCNVYHWCWSVRSQDPRTLFSWQV